VTPLGDRRFSSGSNDEPPTAEQGQPLAPLEEGVPLTAVTKESSTPDVSEQPSDNGPKDLLRAGKEQLDESRARERARQRSGSDG
jgi:hypothetical protein